MEKRSYFINNPSSDLLRIPELNISLPPGISNLFELNDKLNYEQIVYCAQNGTLYAAMENGLCYPIPDPINNKSFSDDILIRKPLQIQILPSRARFTVVKNTDDTVFDSIDDKNLFDDDNIKPARELEAGIKKITDNIEKVEATIKQANLQDKPIENRYVMQQIKEKTEDGKIKDNIAMKYVTCGGKNANGKRCMRRAKTGKQYCGLHNKQG